jgi:hypothetical protein
MLVSGLRRMMKRISNALFAIALLLSTTNLVYASNPEIVEIRKIYNDVQKEILSPKTKVIDLVSEAGQDGYVIKDWHLKSDKQEYKKGAYEALVSVSNKRIIKTRIITQSLSGDWAYTIEYYYYENGRVAFIYEGTSTYNGYEIVNNEPTSTGKLFAVEKRSYYSRNGKRIRFLIKAFLRRSEKPIDPGQVQDIKADKEYMSICELPFLSKINARNSKACRAK